MNIEDIRSERRRLEAQIELAVKQFRDRCGLEEWQVSVSWGRTTVTTQVGDGPIGQARDVYMASVGVKV